MPVDCEKVTPINQQVVGQHTQEDVSFDSSLHMMKDGSFAQGTFHSAQATEFCLTE
jgi:hypothetical protein